MQIGAETARFPGVLRGRTGESRRAYSRGYTEVSNNIMCVYPSAFLAGFHARSNLNYSRSGTRN